MVSLSLIPAIIALSSTSLATYIIKGYEINNGPTLLNQLIENSEINFLSSSTHTYAETTTAYLTVTKAAPHKVKIIPTDITTLSLSLGKSHSVSTTYLFINSQLYLTRNHPILSS
jgi:hypothetical protein